MLLAGALGQTLSQPEQAATLVLALARHSMLVLPLSLHACGSALVREGWWANCVPAEPGK